MTIKKQIEELFTENKELSLREIYLKLPDVKHEAIRSVLNIDVKKCLTFKRSGKGKYCLLEAKDGLPQ